VAAAAGRGPHRRRGRVRLRPPGDAAPRGGPLRPEPRARPGRWAMTTVRFPTTAVLLGPNAKLPVELIYDSTDPWAVTLAAGPQQWLFARDLLASGCHEPAGDGDVQVRPDTGGVASHIVIALSSPNGAAEVAG